VTDVAADLDLRLEKLGLDLVLEDDPSLFEELLDIGGQLARVGIDKLVLLLDSDSQLGQ
jgi:hypothetical protein